MRHLLSAAATASLLLAQAPVLAEGNADDIGVMSVKLSDVVKSNFGIQAQTQGAGTPNEVGVGGFLPFAVGENSVWFLDSQVNANFEDFNNYSSIVSTTVAGITFSTSSRLGYRWLNSDRSWMYGINAGYDTRPMATGYADTGVSVFNQNTVFFQQAAVNLEAVSNSKSLNAYALLPTGTKQYQINSAYQAGSLSTYGFNAGYNITPELTASVGYYYQDGDGSSADGSGVKGRLAIDVTQNIEFGGTYTYDDAFESRASADLTIRLGSSSSQEKSKEQTLAEEQPQIRSLSATPGNRKVRVHDLSDFNRSKFIELQTRLCDFAVKTVNTDYTGERQDLGMSMYGLNEKDTVRAAVGNDVNPGIYANDSFTCQYDPETGKGSFKYHDTGAVVVKG